jgi:hypothetical protein
MCREAESSPEKVDQLFRKQIFRFLEFEELGITGTRSLRIKALSGHVFRVTGKRFSNHKLNNTPARNSP